jgi:hypothetical protein
MFPATKPAKGIRIMGLFEELAAAIAIAILYLDTILSFAPKIATRNQLLQ